VVVGISGGRPNIEAAGFVLLGCALSISATAVFAVRGFNPGLVAGSTIGPCAAGCLARALILSVVEPMLTAKLRADDL
jgi:Mg/Co/Ni transporter MgtE